MAKYFIVKNCITIEKEDLYLIDSLISCGDVPIIRKIKLETFDIIFIL